MRSNGRRKMAFNYFLAHYSFILVGLISFAPLRPAAVTVGNGQLG